MSPLEANAQHFYVGEYVQLYVLDATILGGGVYRFVPGTIDGDAPSWGGQLYIPIDLIAEGFDVSGKGTLPRPKFTIGNASLTVESTVRSYGDLLGATLTRYQTLRQYLDDGLTPDPNAYWPPDVFEIQQKLEHNKFFITWELLSLLDCEGQKLPRRQLLRDHCTHTYRRWNGTAFDYTKATCWYSGAVYWDQMGTPRPGAPGKDICGKRLKDCRLRFPGKLVLPFRGFPGLAKTRYR